MYITPELGKYANYAGYLFLIIGLLCLIMHFLISTNKEVQNNDIFIQSKNYDDFNSNSLRESLNFPQSNRNEKFNFAKK